MKQFLSVVVLVFFLVNFAFCETAEPSLNIVEAAKIAQDALKASEMKETHFIYSITFSQGWEKVRPHYSATLVTKEQSTEEKNEEKMTVIRVNLDKTTSIEKIDVPRSTTTRRRVVMPAKSD
jgi:hypothetical protein